VAVVEAAPGEARDEVVGRWLAEQRQHGSTVWLLSCVPEKGGIFAGLASLIEGLVPQIRVRAPHLLTEHSQELCLVVPGLRAELSAVRSLTDTSDDEEQTRNYAADRAYRSLHGLIDLLAEWHDVAKPGPWSIVCDDYDAANGLVRRFFVELVRRRGRHLGLRLLLVTGRGRGDEVAGELDPSMITAGVRLSLAARAADQASAGDMSRQASELEARVKADPVVAEVELPRLISCWQRSDTPERALRWQVQAMQLYNHAGLYEASLPYAAVVEANLDRLHADFPTLYFPAVNALYFCYVPLGRADVVLGLVEQAVTVLDDRAALPRLYYLLSMLHARFLSPTDLDKADEYLQRGMGLLPEAEMSEGERQFLTVFLMNGLALVRLRQRRVGDALSLCRDGAARLNRYLGPDRHRLHRSVLLFNLAQVHAQIGPYEDAIAYFTEAMAMDPNYSEYYNDRGSVYLKMGRLEEAERDYLGAIDLSPPYPEVWTNLGQCYRAMDRMADASHAYSRALDLDPTSALALVGRAEARTVLGESELALADYDQALAIEAAQPTVLASRAILHYEAGRVVQAVEDLDAAVVLAPDLADLYQNRAVALTDLGRVSEAVRDLASYLRMSPDADDRAEVEELLESLQPA